MGRRQNTRTIPFRRKQEGKTNYKSRIRLLSTSKPRLVVRKSLKNLLLQFVTYVPIGDKVLLSVHSSALKKLGWKGNLNNIPACYLLGLLAGIKAQENNITACILDIGMTPSIKGSCLYAALKGIVDSGMDIPHSDSVFPDEKTIRGETIANFAKQLKGDKEKFAKQFSLCIKNGLDPETLPAHFDDIKKKIRGKA